MWVQKGEYRAQVWYEDSHVYFEVRTYLFTRQLKKKKKNYTSSHSKCHSILNADQEPKTCTD